MRLATNGSNGFGGFVNQKAPKKWKPFGLVTPAGIEPASRV